MRAFDDADTGAAWRRGTALALALALACLLAVSARVVFFDAYWLYREAPPWLVETGGSSRLLDRQTRRAKALQAMDRDYTVALIGSSTVYHGLDPDDVRPALRGRVFNLGISALSAAELPTIAAIVASRPHVDVVTLGLDYYMLSRVGGPAPLSRDLRTPLGRTVARLGSLFGWYAILDSRLGAVEGSDDPGGWTRAGFRVTPPLPAALTRDNDAVRRTTTAPYRADRLRYVSAALDRLAGRQVRLYLSPVSAAQRRVMADLGLGADFERFRADAAKLARDRGIPFDDLTELGANDPFDPGTGSTASWLDNLHFTPVVGRQVLVALGLRDGDPVVPR